MKEIKQLNKVFENRIRLGIMSVLVAREWVEFGELKELLGVTDGNLSSHVSTLQKHKFVKTRKRFRNNKPNTTYCITVKGRAAFDDHIQQLEAIVKKLR